jgi:hypothetical protein
MKYITVLMLIALSVATASSQSQSKAPLGGRLLDRETIVQYVRLDGSEYTRYNNGDWYLTKEATGTAKMKVPGFVKIKQPRKIIYKTMNGNSFSTYDLKNWVTYNDTECNAINLAVSTNNIMNANILEITKQPAEPVNDDFNIEFKLKNNAKVNLIILDIQGRLIAETSMQMNAGINHFNIPLDKFQAGSYTYKITAGISFYSGAFIKI